jgi:hypothetical protein
MGVDGRVLSPLVHQDDLRLYSSKDISKIYHNRKMKTFSTQAEISSEAPDSSGEVESEGEELLLLGQVGGQGQSDPFESSLNSKLKRVRFC